jgi:FkbM family methyltransferase
MPQFLATLRNTLARRPRVRELEDQIYDVLVEPGDVCWDIGGNVGDMAVRLSRLTGPSGLVVSFEPVWPTYRRLCAAAQNRRRGVAPIVTVPVGLSDSDRRATVQVPAGDFGQGSLAGTEHWRAAQQGAAIHSYDCELRSLDSLLAASRLPPPAVMKIDVEGAERFVLEGARGLFASGARPLMLMELYAPWQRAFGHGPWQVLEPLLALGYEVLFVCPEGLVAHRPCAEAPFPPQYERGYNVLVHAPAQHATRIARLAHLRPGGGGPILPMPPAPYPNRIEPLASVPGAGR